MPNTPIHALVDFPAIRQIQAALWGTGEILGAAVMVGSGYCRNALLPSDTSPKPPLWLDFCKAMSDKLYPGDGAPRDPLRLAEEFEAILGRTALEGLIFDLVRDKEWSPGPLHESLVSLPWADILTTNWDTLLERAADNAPILRTYRVVRTIEDIPRTRAPRIVKLHGSMPSNRPFIFTQEDYRSYPRRFAPYVNLVQQVLLENELCLLGFSGDDPNFLEWSGWVRDQLGAAARRIHLVGVLHLSPSHRKVLESRHISPIDLAPLVADVDRPYQHTVATERFLSYLQSTKTRPPSDWCPAASSVRAQQHLGMSINNPDPAAAAKRIQEIAQYLRKDRESYPHWLVCPADKRRHIRSIVSDVSGTLQSAWNQLPASEQSNVLYELIWCFDTALIPVFPYLQNLAVSVLENPTFQLGGSERRYLAAILLRTAREEQNVAAFDKWSAFLQENPIDLAEALAAVQYERALWARDQLDWASVLTLIAGIDAADPIWKLRRAALLCELGESKDGAKLIREAAIQLRDRYLRDRSSIWIISRLAWAAYLLRTASWPTASGRSLSDTLPEQDGWFQMFSANKCDPWEELSSLDRESSDAFVRNTEQTRHERPGFDAGRFTKTVYSSNSAGNRVAYETTRLGDLIGLPPQIGLISVHRPRLSRAVELQIPSGDEGFLSSIRAMSGTSDELLERQLGSVHIARASVETINRLIPALWKAIDFGRTRLVRHDKMGRLTYNSFWIDRVGLYLEVLSRFSVRHSGEQAVNCFRRAAAFTNTLGPNDWQVFEATNNLLNRSLSALAPHQRHALILDIVNLPLPDEKGITGDAVANGPMGQWPQVFMRIPKPWSIAPQHEPDFRARIDTLISKTRLSDNFTRLRAALRLCWIQNAGALTAEQVNAFGEAVWSKPDPGTELPSFLGHEPRLLVLFPSPDENRASAIFRTKILKPGLATPLSVESLTILAAITRPQTNNSRALELTSEEATGLFDSILVWTPRAIPMDLNSENRRSHSAIGILLSESILPRLDASTLGADRIIKLLAAIENGILPSAVAALPDVVRLDPSRTQQAVRLIHRAVLNDDDDIAAEGFAAIHRWRDLVKQKKLEPWPDALREIAITIAATRREPALRHALWLLIHLCSQNELRHEDMERLAESLDSLFTDTSYDLWNTHDPQTNARTVSLTSVRAQSVRLAHELQKAGIKHNSIDSWLANRRL